MHVCRNSPLLTLTPSGLYCPDADVYLDPWRPVPRALISHAHADHARAGSGRYLTHTISVPLLRHRISADSERVEGIEYGEVKHIRGVRFSFHPAGHVPGSAQILVERGGERWVFSGDYKTESDGVSTPFEIVKCDTFISECTFGLPIFRWRPQVEVFHEIHSWWRENQQGGRSSILCVYSLGKAQRVMAHLDKTVGHIGVHPAVWNISEALGFPLEGFSRLSVDYTPERPLLVIAPPAVIGTPWLRRFGENQVASASGWMTIRGMKRRRGVDRGFVLSDHADFSGLATAIAHTGASRVLLTHGYTAAFGRWLKESRPALEVGELGTEYSGDLGDA